MRRTIMLCIAGLLLAGAAIADEQVDSTQVGFMLGYRYLTVDGNEWRFRQYASPDDGPFASSMSVHFEKPNEPEEPMWDLNAVALSPRDIDTTMRWTGGWPIPFVDVYYSRYLFHPEVLRFVGEGEPFDRAYTADSAQRRDFGATGMFYWMGDTPVEVSYRRTTYAGSGWIRGLATPATPDFDTRHVRIAKERQLTDWLTVGTEFTERRFSDGTMLQPDSRTRTGTIRLTAPIGTVASVQGEYTRGDVKQKGLEGLDYTGGGVTFDAAWDSGFALQAYANRTTIDNDVTLSPYTKAVTRTGLKASYVGPKRLSVRGGVELSAFKQELAGSATSEEEPDRTSYWASFSARPTDQVRLRARYRASDTSGLEKGAEGSMPDRRSRGQVDVSITPWDRLAVTFSGSKETRENPNEGIDVDLATYGATLWTQLSDQVALFGHYCLFDWDTNSSVLVGNVSDAAVWGGYVQITSTPNSYVSLGYEYARSEDSADTKDQMVTLGVGWSANPANRYSIEYRHQTFDDWVMGSSSFKANVVSVSGRFEY